MYGVIAFLLSKGNAPRLHGFCSYSVSPLTLIPHFYRWVPWDLQLPNSYEILPFDSLSPRTGHRKCQLSISLAPTKTSTVTVSGWLKRRFSIEVSRICGPLSKSLPLVAEFLVSPIPTFCATYMVLNFGASMCWVSVGRFDFWLTDGFSLLIQRCASLASSWLIPSLLILVYRLIWLTHHWPKITPK